MIHPAVNSAIPREPLANRARHLLASRVRVTTGENFNPRTFAPSPRPSPTIIIRVSASRYVNLSIIPYACVGYCGGLIRIDGWRRDPPPLGNFPARSDDGRKLRDLILATVQQDVADIATSVAGAREYHAY